MLNDRHSWLLFGGNLLNKIESCQINTLCAKVNIRYKPDNAWFLYHGK